jgi:hypothetical protein
MVLFLQIAGFNYEQNMIENKSHRGMNVPEIMESHLPCKKQRKMFR